MPRLILTVLAALVMVAGAAVGAAAQGSDDGSRSDAGRIASFSGGVLIIDARGGDPVSGRVTRATEIECERDDDDRGRRQGRDDDRGRGRDQDDDDRGRDRDDDADDTSRGRGDDDRACSVSELTDGARVRKAELRLSGRGQTWDEVELAG